MGHNGGRAQVNVDYGGGTYNAPFIDAVKNGNGWFTGTPGTNWRTLLDSRGYPTAMPSGGGSIWFLPQLWIWGVAGDTWVLDWPGTASMSLPTPHAGWASGDYTINVINSNRIEYTLIGNPISYGQYFDGSQYPSLLTSITITSMAANAFAGGSIRLYLKDGSPSGPDYETRLNRGEVWNPTFTRIVGPFGVVRFMNWNLTALYWPGIGKWADRSPVDMITYFGTSLPFVQSQFYCGPSTGTSAQVVSQPPSSFGSWTHGQRAQWLMTAPPTFVYPAELIAGNPTTVHSIAHGLSNGQHIQFPSQDWNAVWHYISSQTFDNAYRFQTVTVVDADHFTVAFDSTGGGPPPTLAIAAFTGSIAGTALTVSSGLQIAAGQVVTGAGVAAGTQILSGSGTSWTVSISQTVGSEPMTSIQVLPYTPVMTLTVGALAPVECVQQIYSATFSPPGWDFGQVAFQPGDYIDGIYDANLNKLMCYPNQGVGTGVPLEILLNFVNANGNHPHFCIPVIASDDYVTQFATLLKNNLAVGLIAMIELANEVWNSQFTSYCYALGIAEIGVAATFHSWYGKRVSEIAALFKAAWPGGSYRILMGVDNRFVGAYGNDPSMEKLLDFTVFGINATITIANPAVITTASPHGRSVGDLMMLTTTNTLPAPFINSFRPSGPPVAYYIVSANFGASTLSLATTPGGTPISTLGSTQSGTHQICHPPMADCDAIVHAPYFDNSIIFGTAANYPSTAPVAGGWADQIYNYTQGGAGRIAAFEYYKQNVLHASLDPTDFPDGGYCVDKLLNIVIPYWISIAQAFGKDLQQYEGGQNLIGNCNGANINNPGGFPVTAPTSGQTVTVQNVINFNFDFYGSTQFADVITTVFNGAANLGTKWPSYYTIWGPEQVGQYWDIYRVNTGSYNGFTDAPATPGYLALLAFNNFQGLPVNPQPPERGHKGHIHYNLDWVPVH